MKLNYKRTILVGFAFFLICHFWQAYEAIIPMILTDKFGMSQTWSGVIMALDNILALFMLPVFGAISDKCKSKRGKRTPFILIGTLVACAAMVLLCFADTLQTSKMAEVDPFGDNRTTALTTLYDADPVIKAQPTSPITEHLSKLISESDFTSIEALESDGTVRRDFKDFVEPTLAAYGDRTDLGSAEEVRTRAAGGDKATLKNLYALDPVITAVPKQQVESELHNFIGREEFLSIIPLENGKTTTGYDEYILPARQAYASDSVSQSPGALIFFIGTLLVMLFAMGVFRSPAVALMPDVTPKPLRSKGNAIINLMGAAGGILVMLFGMLFGTAKVENSLMGYTAYFLVVMGVMLASLLIFALTVKEPQWAKEADEDYKKYYPEEAAAEPMDETPKDRKLTKGERLSLILILASVALWFMGYNAVTSKFSVYSRNVLGQNFNIVLTVAQAAAIVSYIPVGIVSSKIGRKKAILAGITMLTLSFTAAAFITKDTPFAMMMIFFVLAGIGWATINVNSFPMVVELATGSNTGKYTGYYYTASMAAQIVTPIFSGVFLDINMRTLFPYAAIFSGLSFVTMLFVKHGDSKPIRKSALEAIGDADD